jgi:hypothetical protein
MILKNFSNFFIKICIAISNHLLNILYVIDKFKAKQLFIFKSTSNK